MQKIDIRPMGPHEYAVRLTEGTDTTHHRVTVPEDLVDDLGITDERRLVHESFEFLLERYSADSIRDEFDLDDISREDPAYTEEIRTRLS